MSEHIVTQDPSDYTRTRGLLSRLLTTKRLKENEDFMWRLADQQLDEFASQGTCEFLEHYARPFSGLVIVDLLGIPPEDHEEFRAVFSGQVVGGIEDDALTRAHNPLNWLNDKFSTYIAERRREPRGDVLTELAEAKYPDGSTPDIIDVVRLATFLFAAGQETTTKVLSFGMQVIAERPDIQTYLREERDRIPALVEETLRMESPVKSHFRMARTSTSIGDVPNPRRMHGDVVARGKQSRRAEVRKTPTTRKYIARTFASTWHSDAATTPALARRWLERRDESRSTGSSTGCPASPSVRRRMALLKHAATPTNRPGRCGA